jgi:gamma-glutamyl hercynylcysteine S-oxide synthase
MESAPADPAPADGARLGGRSALEPLLASVRDCTLAHARALREALGPEMTVAYSPVVNPPLWELGHVAWFEEFWLGRNPERLRGAAASVDAPRGAAALAQADALYDSSRVAHTRRWHLALPDLPRTLDYLARVRERSLRLLHGAREDDDALYLFRLALAHEAMHHEAGLMIAQELALPVPAPSPPGPVRREPLRVPAGVLQAGHAGAGFAFDNEHGSLAVPLNAFEIDSAPVPWADLLAFVADGGYDDPACWTREGWDWRQRARPAGLPRHLVRDDTADSGFKQRWFGQWRPIDPAEPAMHLAAHEAQAWCRWAGRRLPTEHEWVHAQACAQALAHTPSGQHWTDGQVWEWTASAFEPWPGFVAHAYRDYSQPWFDGRPVLKGGSFATQPFMRHPRYRNYFVATRDDVFAGFRSCAVA